jgi:hypothetical protein
MKVTRRLGRLSGAIAAAVAIAATGTGVMAASYSTFTATTSTPANSWSSGSLTLTNDASGALFTASTGALTGTKCIKVTSGGSYSGLVKLYSTGFAQTNGLGDHITLTIDVGSAGGSGSYADCTGFSSTANVYSGTLKNFDATYTSWATGASTNGWNTTAGTPDSRVFRFAWSYDSTAPQNATASDTFTWEAHTS